MRVDKILWAGLAALAVVSCTPALNWREVQLPGSGIVVLFPCKPDHFARNVTLAGTTVQMVLASCSAAGVTYALSHADMPDPTQVTVALSELRAAAGGNIGGDAKVLGALSISGMTPNPAAERLMIEGRRADGTPLREQAGFFAKGMRVYQATMVGGTIDTEAADTFFTGLKLVP